MIMIIIIIIKITLCSHLTVQRDDSSLASSAALVKLEKMVEDFTIIEEEIAELLPA